jgi:uncharacterized membrane protein (DUF106 family)
MIRYILIFCYLAVSIILFVLNWDLFTTVLDFDFGFGTYAVMPFLILQVLGLLVLGIFALVDHFKDLKREVKISELQNRIVNLQKDAEISALKSSVDAKGKTIEKLTEKTQIETL